MKNLRHLGVGVASICLVVVSVEARSEEVRVHVGRTRENLSTFVSESPLPVLGAVMATGGMMERDVILIVRRGVFYAIDDEAKRAGGLKVKLKNGDEVTLLGSNNSLYEFRKLNPTVIVGVEAVKKLSAE